MPGIVFAECGTEEAGKLFRSYVEAHEYPTSSRGNAGHATTARSHSSPNPAAQDARECFRRTDLRRSKCAETMEPLGCEQPHPFRGSSAHCPYRCVAT